MTELDCPEDRWISFGWLVAVPLGLIEWALLGWVLPRIVHPPNLALIPTIFLPEIGAPCKPEPLEQARYVAGISAAFLWYLGATLFYQRWVKRHAALGQRARLAATGAVVLIQLLLCASAAYLWSLNTSDELPYFSGASLTGALLLAAFLVWVFLLAAPKVPAADSRRAARLLPFTLLAVFIILGLLPTVFTTGNIMHASNALLHHDSFTFEDFAAVMAGRTPLVDYSPQYQLFLPLLFYPVFKLFGTTLTTFCITMALLSAAELTLAYAILKQLTRSAWAALALFVPFAAIGFISLPDSLTKDELVNSFTLYMQHPLRTFGPWLVAFLLARYLAKPSPRGMIGVFVTGAFSAVNNVDFGLPAFLAGLVVILATADVGLLPTRKHAQEILLRALGSAAFAVAVFSALCLFHSGHLPRFGHFLDVQKKYVLYGAGMLPMPDLGIYWIVFATFLGAIVVALLGLARDETGAGELRERHGMLLFSGFFGFGASMYYVGRSHPHSMFVVFAFWSFALGLLLWEAFTTWRTAAPRRHLWITVIPTAFLLTQLAICLSALNLLSPVGQVKRLGLVYPLLENRFNDMAAFVRKHSTPGEHVVISYPYAHLVGMKAGVDNVYPFGVAAEVFTYAQIDELMDAIHQNHVTRVFGQIRSEVEARLVAEGFRKLDVIHLGDVWLFSSPFEFWEAPGPLDKARDAALERGPANRGLPWQTQHQSSSRT